MKFNDEKHSVSFDRYQGESVVDELRRKRWKWDGSTKSWVAPGERAYENYKKAHIEAVKEDEKRRSDMIGHEADPGAMTIKLDPDAPKVAVDLMRVKMWTRDGDTWKAPTREAFKNMIERFKKPVGELDQMLMDAMVYTGPKYVWDRELKDLGFRWNNSKGVMVTNSVEAYLKMRKLTDAPACTDPTKVPGDGYAHRETLRKMGMWFDDDTKMWWAPNKEVAEQARKYIPKGPEMVPLRVVGDTYHHREKLKELGCQWNGSQWMCSEDQLAKATAIIDGELAEPGVKTKMISRGSGYGGTPFTKGDVIRMSDHEMQRSDLPRWVYVLSAGERYYREDGMSFGVGEDSGYIYLAKVRPATDEEAAPHVAREKAKIAKKEAQQRLSTIFNDVFKRGSSEGVNDIKGRDIHLDTPSAVMHGAGQWFVISGKKVMAVRNNGADGDDWSLNNYRTSGAGAIARWVEDDGLANEVEALAGRIAESFIAESALQLMKWRMP
jgi:hypothetical protein